MVNCLIAIVLITFFAAPLDAEQVASNASDAKSLSQDSRKLAVRESYSSIAFLSQQARSLLHAEANSTSKSDQIAMTLNIVAMVEDLSTDPRFEHSRQLKKLRTSLFTRLRSVRKDLEADIRRKKKQKSNLVPKRPSKIEIDPTVLAQLNQAAIGNGNQAGGNVANAGAGQDYAPMLIEIIQRAISPQSWDVNGGASTIQYWRPGMALVIRAPESVHREVGPLVGQLRKQ